MKLNRKWLLAIALVMSLTMAISGTLAYLTDRDTVENVFTMGNVDIEVEEEFDQNSPLYPGVEVDKEAGIKNVHASEPAYVWMVVSVPNNLAQYIELGWAGSYSATTVTSPHAGYTGYLVKYPTALTAGSSTGNILESVKLAANVDYQNGQYVAVSGGQTTPIGDLSDVKIMVDGFAIQTEGFDGVDAAYTAYTTQWGGLTGGESGTGSEGGEPSITYTEVANADALSTALANGENVKLTESITTDGITIPSGKSVVVNLNGNELIGSEYTKDDGSQSRNNVFVNNGNLTITGSGTITTRNLMNNSGAKLVINGNISIVGGVAAGGSAIWNEGDCEINGATISQTNDWNYAVQNIGTATMKITNATVSANHGAISNTSSGTLTIDGGDYTCLASGHTVYVTAGTVTINSGSFNHQQSNATAEGNVVIYANNGSVVVNGGSFDSVSAAFGYNSHKSNMTINESNCTFANAAANWYQ